jgi:hypothetical protein
MAYTLGMKKTNLGIRFWFYPATVTKWTGKPS